MRATPTAHRPVDRMSRGALCPGILLDSSRLTARCACLTVYGDVLRVVMVNDDHRRMTFDVGLDLGQVCLSLTFTVLSPLFHCLSVRFC